MKLNTQDIYGLAPEDQLAKEIFTCCKCQKPFSHIDGTWLPVGIEDKSPVPILEGGIENPPLVLSLTEGLRSPEIITSEDFTCYGCL